MTINILSIALAILFLWVVILTIAVFTATRILGDDYEELLRSVHNLRRRIYEKEKP